MDSKGVPGEACEISIGLCRMGGGGEASILLFEEIALHLVGGLTAGSRRLRFRLSKQHKIQPHLPIMSPSPLRSETAFVRHHFKKDICFHPLNASYMVRLHDGNLSPVTG